MLFNGSTPTACGTGDAAMGPFYCPSDRKVYIDLAFYRELKDRFHAPGEFAEAYIIQGAGFIEPALPSRGGA